MHFLALKTVFSNIRYVIAACVIFTAMFLALIYISEYLFISPYLTLYVPDYGFLGFSLIALVSALTGLVLSMAIYNILSLKAGKKSAGSGFAGSIIGTAAGTCSCSSVGFAIFSIFGVAGSTATSFLREYEIPLRLLSIAILIVTYFYTARKISAECRLKI